MTATARIIDTTRRMGASVVSNGILYSEFTVAAVEGVTWERAMELLAVCAAAGVGADAYPAKRDAWDVCCGLSQRERVRQIAQPVAVDMAPTPAPAHASFAVDRRVRRELRLLRASRAMKRAYRRGYRLG